MSRAAPLWPISAICCPAFTSWPSFTSRARFVAVGRQPLVVVLDDDQFAITDQAGTRIHHHAVGGRAHRLARAAGDVDALPGRVAGGIGIDQRTLGRPAPCERRVRRSRRDRRRRCRRGRRRHGARRRRAARDRRGARIQAQTLPGIDGVRRRDAVPQREVERGDAVDRGDVVDRVAALHDGGGAIARRGHRTGGGELRAARGTTTGHAPRACWRRTRPAATGSRKRQ